MGVPGNVKIAGPYLTTGRATVKIFRGARPLLARSARSDHLALN